MSLQIVSLSLILLVCDTNPGLESWKHNSAAAWLVSKVEIWSCKSDTRGTNVIYLGKIHSTKCDFL